jgi:membrane fusion protein (multidrug efflux system)
VRLILGVVAAVILLGSGGWYAAHKGRETTDDAQVEADVIAVPAQTSGVVEKVLFEENQPVKAGDVLAIIDPAAPTAKLAQAEAELASAKAAADAADSAIAVVEVTSKHQKSAAEASLAGATVGVTASTDEIAQAEAAVTAAKVTRDKTKLDAERAQKLFDTGAISKQEADSAKAAYDAAEARLTQAEAQRATVRASTAQARTKIDEARAKLGQTSASEAQIAEARAQAAAAHARVENAKAVRDLAALDLDHTKIVAPHDGVASKKSIVVGQMVAAGQPVVMIVPVHDAWVVANFKETQLSHMRVGQPADVEIDAYPGVVVHGEVESLSGATGSRFSLLPPDNASGNFTKVVQRVPVRIELKDPPPDHPLRPGMSVEVTVDSRH